MKINGRSMLILGTIAIISLIYAGSSYLRSPKFKVGDCFKYGTQIPEGQVTAVHKYTYSLKWLEIDPIRGLSVQGGYVPIKSLDEDADRIDCEVTVFNGVIHDSKK